MVGHDAVMDSHDPVRNHWLVVLHSFLGTRGNQSRMTYCDKRWMGVFGRAIGQKPADKILVEGSTNHPRSGDGALNDLDSITAQDSKSRSFFPPRFGKEEQVV